MSIAEIWKQEGSKLKLIEMTTKALESKFKDVPNEISAKIEQSDSDTLEEVILKLVDRQFKNIDEVREFL